MAPRPLVIGLTGSTRSGKSWVARLLSERLGVPEHSTVGQDSFWCRAVRVKAPNGEEMVSEEEPDCTDHGAFARAIEEAVESAAKASRGYVIAEGFQLVHDERVPRLLDHIFFFDLSREDCIARRSAKQGPMNPNPMSVRKCEALVWPAHERYIADKVKPLGKRVHWVKAPTSPDEAAAIVEAICAVVGLGGAGASAASLPQAVPAALAVQVEPPAALVPPVPATAPPAPAPIAQEAASVRPPPPPVKPPPPPAPKAELSQGRGIFRFLTCGCGS